MKLIFTEWCLPSWDFAELFGADVGQRNRLKGESHENLFNEA